MVTKEQQFRAALDEFVAAGHKLVEAWDAEGFNADETFGAPADWYGNPLLTHSLDDWLMEFAEHYEPAAHCRHCRARLGYTVNGDRACVDPSCPAYNPTAK